MVLSIDEHQAAERAINQQLPWVDTIFKQNWIARLDFIKSTHAEACSIDRELHAALVANNLHTPAGNIANQYNHDVVHFAHDRRYLDLAALPIFIQSGPNSTVYQWDDLQKKPAAQALEFMGSAGLYKYDWDPNNPRTSSRRIIIPIRKATTSNLQLPAPSSQVGVNINVNVK